ncbi:MULTISPECIES: hypothetical protein [Dictyoglomus]|jgi:hypothetical protein|uniref:Uncharacterized protein n=1 Tax=Dictyoglomus turgidum (strain DSM 6724 / Z-1310) TaxID=515635 RepID=B8DZU3_DICTD|nr:MULTISPECIES: hypothetical protein [Dictyoglomus]ACK42026.1 conserved hypothetical protein [Dictyoglomus turgidum DSM 6724]PNV80894.1 MAG: hypothetical protein C0196_00495 [Dictyoglomus turgidum]HBU31413.1 hypothetical protein [Dictyoglomus sp.]
MKKNNILVMLLLLCFLLTLVFAQTQTPTKTQPPKRQATIFILHVLTFDSLSKTNLEKDLKALDDTFRMGIPIYHPAIGLNLSFYTKLHQKGLPYPSMINRILKNLVAPLSSSNLPEKTGINIVLYTQDDKDLYNGKTLFLNFALSAVKEYAKTKDLNKFGAQIIAFLETEKLEYKNGVFSSKNYDFEWILKL